MVLVDRCEIVLIPRPQTPAPKGSDDKKRTKRPTPADLLAASQNSFDENMLVTFYRLASGEGWIHDMHSQTSGKPCIERVQTLPAKMLRRVGKTTGQAVMARTSEGEEYRWAKIVGLPGGSSKAAVENGWEPRPSRAKASSGGGDNEYEEAPQWKVRIVTAYMPLKERDGGEPYPCPPAPLFLHLPLPLPLPLP